MHKHKRHHHYGGHGWHFGGWFWMIGLWVLFSSGHGIWPGILILVGISMVFGSFFREEQRPPKAPDIPLPVDPLRPHRPTPQPASTPKPTPTPATPPAEPIHRTDLLPMTCIHCGGPVRAHEVKWTGKQSAACSYCGSNLKMNK